MAKEKKELPSWKTGAVTAVIKKSFLWLPFLIFSQIFFNRFYFLRWFFRFVVDSSNNLETWVVETGQYLVSLFFLLLKVLRRGSLEFRLECITSGLRPWLGVGCHKHIASAELFSEKPRGELWIQLGVSHRFRRKGRQTARNYSLLAHLSLPVGACSRV